MASSSTSMVILCSCRAAPYAVKGMKRNTFNVGIVKVFWREGGVGVRIALFMSMYSSSPVYHIFV